MLKIEMVKRIAELGAMLRAKDEEIRLLEYNSRRDENFATKINNATIVIEAIIQIEFPAIQDEWGNDVLPSIVEKPNDRHHLMMLHLLKLLKH